MSEVVYFIQSINGGPIKIGKAANAKKRLCALQISHHEELQIIAIDHNGNEADYHDKFFKYRIRGEWFNPDQEILDAISFLDKLPAADKIKKRMPIAMSRIRYLIEKGTLRCQWCHLKINEENGCCPKCNRDKCYVSWYDLKTHKAIRSRSFQYNIAVGILIEINKEYKLLKEMGQHSKFDANSCLKHASVRAYKT